MLALVDFFAWWHPYKSRGRRSTLARKVTSPKLKIGIASFRPNTRTHSLFVPDKPYLGTSMEARQDAAMLAFATLAPLTSRRTTLEPLVSRRAAHIPLATRRVARASLARPSQPTPASAGDNYLQFTTATAFKSLLTRRAVYTQAYYYREMQDAPTHNWLVGFENFQDRVSRNEFTDNGEFVYNMLHTQKVTATVTIGHPRGRFKREFKFNIDPFKVGSRVLSSRLQLSKEWSHDLKCVALENKEIERMGLERMFEADAKKLESLRGRVFDYDNFSNEQSPLRFKNYQKLRLFVTQQAIARLEVHLRDTSNHDYMFFRSFVKQMQPLTDDESFILGLMALAPENRVNPPHQICPKSLARGLMDMRVLVAEECIAVMNGISAEQEAWERQRLEASMNISNTPGDDFKSEGSDSLPGNDSTEIGESQPSSANANSDPSV